MEDGFAEVVSTLVSDYDSGAMPKAQNEDFIPEFKKYIKVHGNVNQKIASLVMSDFACNPVPLLVAHSCTCCTPSMETHDALRITMTPGMSIRRFQGHLIPYT